MFDPNDSKDMDQVIKEANQRREIQEAWKESERDNANHTPTEVEEIFENSM